LVYHPGGVKWSAVIVPHTCRAGDIVKGPRTRPTWKYSIKIKKIKITIEFLSSY